MFLLALLATPSLACSLVPNDDFLTDPTLAQGDAPASPELIDLFVQRGTGPKALGFGRMSATSCDDLGWISISLDQQEDDYSVGYRIEVVDGSLPAGMRIPDTPLTGIGNHDLVFSWGDEAKNKQEPVFFVLELTPVDEAGVEGEPLEVVVDDPGSQGRGCSSVGALPSAGWLVLSPLVLLGRRRQAAPDTRGPGSSRC